MRLSICPFVVMFALCLTACHADPAPAQLVDTQVSTPNSPASVEPAHAPAPEPDQATLLADRARKGMAYSDFRRIVLDQGWRPKPDAECLANVVGGDYNTWCPANPGDVMCRVCEEAPELSSCSGDGHCLMQFSHEGVDKTLAVGTYGEINDWNAPADKSRLSVTGWEYDAPADQ